MKTRLKYEVRVYPGGSKFWYLGGERHREDGPACEWADGYNCWYLNGREYTEDGHTDQMARRRGTCSGKTVTIDGKTYRLTEV